MKMGLLRAVFQHKGCMRNYGDYGFAEAVIELVDGHRALWCKLS